MAMLVLFADQTAHRPTLNRPARKGKRWVPVIKVRWIYSDRGEFAPYGREYYAGEMLVKVDLPADRPPLEWDL